MGCKQVRENLAAHLAGELPETALLTMRSHLHICRPCQDYSAELERLESVCDLWEEVDPTPTFEARVRAALQARPVPAKRSFRHWFKSLGTLPLDYRIPVLAAMLFLTISLSVLVMQTRVADDDTTLVEFIPIMEDDINRLKDFDVIAKLELLDYFDEVKSQLALPEPASK